MGVIISLKNELKSTQNQVKKRVPKVFTNYMESQTQKLKRKGYEENALQVGDKFPDGKLMNFNGELVSFKDLINGKATIITFYRGAWCPYCNLELQAYNKLIEEEDMEISMIAISPEKPDTYMKSESTQSLNLTVLSDINNKFAKELKLVFKTSRMLRVLMKLGGIDLKDSQGNNEGELPMPATYIIDDKGAIVYAFIDADYTVRAEPSEVIERYKGIVSGSMKSMSGTRKK